jgi:hypothetical protein
MRPLTFRNKLLFGSALAIAVVAGVAFVLWPREPRYEGKPLSYWVDHLPATLVWTNIPYSTIDAGSHKEFLATVDTAGEAVDALGPRCLGTLVQRLRSRETTIPTAKERMERIEIL